MKSLPLIAASIVFTMVPSTTVAAMDHPADSGTSDESANCEIILDDVVETPEAEEAEVTPEKEMQFTCMSNIVTVQNVDSDGDPLSPGVAYNTATENAVVLPEQDDPSAEAVQDDLEVILGPGAEGRSLGGDDSITGGSAAVTPASSLSGSSDLSVG